MVNSDLSVPDHPETFVLGEFAASFDATGKPLPGLAPVAIQARFRHWLRALFTSASRSLFTSLGVSLGGTSLMMILSIVPVNLNGIW